MDIDQIVNQAIPYEDCQRKESEAKVRREQLKKRIENLLTERDKSKPFMPDIEYKSALTVFQDWKQV